MSDARTEALKRLYRQTGAEVDRVVWVTALYRAGEIDTGARLRMKASFQSTEKRWWEITLMAPGEGGATNVALHGLAENGDELRGVNAVWGAPVSAVDFFTAYVIDFQEPETDPKVLLGRRYRTARAQGYTPQQALRWAKTGSPHKSQCQHYKNDACDVCRPRTEAEVRHEMRAT